ncbi:MAG: hypothetical protein QOH10_1231, partial [Actinomycetota bacterium]|nr:hypothetical protein [Actinomycetota bacterium]
MKRAVFVTLVVASLALAAPAAFAGNVHYKH